MKALVLVLVLLLLGYVANDRLMAWDQKQQYEVCRANPVGDWVECWQDHDRWPVDF